jgi:calcium-translocating P-type ATPase
MRNGLRRVLGPVGAEVFFGGLGALTLTLSDSPLGLAVTGAGAFRLFTEVRARRHTWQRYEQHLESGAVLEPDEVVQLAAGERVPLDATVLEGVGTAVGPSGLPTAVGPGDRVAAGDRLAGGPFRVDLHSSDPFLSAPRPSPPRSSLPESYLAALSPVSLLYAAMVGLATRSLRRTFTSLLLVNPRPALIGSEAADLGASARVLRAGVVVVGTRPGRAIRRPDILLLGEARLLTDGLELDAVHPLTPSFDPAELLRLAAGVAAAAASPWGPVFPVAAPAAARDGRFEDDIASAHIGGIRYLLEGAGPNGRGQQPGGFVLALRRSEAKQPLALLSLRPRLSPGVADLVETCRREGVRLAVLPGSEERAPLKALAERAGVELLDPDDPVVAIRACESEGDRVWFLSDSADAAPAFAACDLAIGLAGVRSPQFLARADLVCFDLDAVAATVTAAGRRGRAARDAVILSLAANGVGAAWAARGDPGVRESAYPVHAAALGALTSAWLLLRGGLRPPHPVQIADPRPERWGEQTVASVLGAFATGRGGLAGAEARGRRRPPPVHSEPHRALLATLEQLRSPLTGILAVGAGVSFLLGATADVLLIGAVIVANSAVAAWQEGEARRATEALEELGGARARVLRDGREALIAAVDVVPGDLLLLGAGDRVAADARLLEADGLEVDEAVLTGESVPVAKSPAMDAAEARIVLEGSDVTVGRGRAIVVAVGSDSRLGATAAALALQGPPLTQLGERMTRMLHELLPVIVAGGVIVFASGFVRRRPPLTQLALAASVGIAAVPEGLPLLAGVAEAAVARRLAARNAHVRRLAAVEALGRVDVACVDKTGTLTTGRLAVRLLADADGEGAFPAPGSPVLRDVLRVAALASPHPQESGAAAHPTDRAVLEAAASAGFEDELLRRREAESHFDPVQSFHAAVVGGRVHVKGAAEVLAPRCSRLRRGGRDELLDEAGRTQLLARAEHLAERGLRVLMVAVGEGPGPVDDPRDLIALGFVGISDPLRPSVPAAVRRCQQAGVRVIMLTGDHPATARAIAAEAGLDGHDDDVLLGREVAELDEETLAERLEHTSVIARISPLDKLRIVHILRRGHTVAMTGDGVNDAPALRLADVGVAMGQAGSEVARAAADLVLADDDFATLAEALVEGRSFWLNIRRGLGLLLGGNLGELGLMAAASALVPETPLSTRQVLAVNLVTDVLPAVAIAVQQPEHRDLARLAREGMAGLDAPLRRDILRRGTATATPALANYLLARRLLGGPEAQSVAFASIVVTQLAQTLDASWADGRPSNSVLGAVAGSAGILAASLTVRPLRDFLGLTALTAPGVALTGGGGLAAVLLARSMADAREERRRARPARAPS